MPKKQNETQLLELLDWLASTGVNEEVEAEAVRRGLPPVPVVQMIDRHEGYSWYRAVCALGILERAPTLPALSDT